VLPVILAVRIKASARHYEVLTLNAGGLAAMWSQEPLRNFIKDKDHEESRQIYSHLGSSCRHDRCSRYAGLGG
jgi:hypothetical protein